MLKIRIVSVGKVKEKYFEAGISEYAKRLEKYCDLSFFTVEEENYRSVTPAVSEKILKKEEERLLPLLKGYVIGFAIEGKKLSSEKFSGLITSLKNEGKEITFVIGSSYGLSDAVKEKCNALVSFSDMTFPHTLFKLMLTEQIYRAFTIAEGTPYHK